MNTYIKKVVTLSKEEKTILRSAAEIMGELYSITEDSDFDRAETILIDAYTQDSFETETAE